MERSWSGEARLVTAELHVDHVQPPVEFEPDFSKMRHWFESERFLQRQARGLVGGGAADNGCDARPTWRGQSGQEAAPARSRAGDGHREYRPRPRPSAHIRPATSTATAPPSRRSFRPRREPWQGEPATACGTRPVVPLPSPARVDTCKWMSRRRSCKCPESLRGPRWSQGGLEVAPNFLRSNHHEGYLRVSHIRRFENK